MTDTHNQPTFPASEREDGRPPNPLAHRAQPQSTANAFDVCSGLPVPTLHRERQPSRDRSGTRILAKFGDKQKLYLENEPLLAAGKHGVYVLERHRAEPQQMRTHIFNEHMIMLSMSAKAVPFSSRLNGRRVNGEFIPGWVRFLAAGDCLATSWSVPHECILVAVHPHVIRRAMGEELSGTPAELSSNIALHDDPTLAHLMLAMEGYLTSGRGSGGLFEQSLLAAVAARLLSAYGGIKSARPHRTPLTKWKRKRIEEYVRENLSLDIGLQDIANHVNLSPYHLSRIFKASTGQSLWQYVLECRVRKAMSLIRSGPPYSLAHISHRCGFESYSQFISAFRRFVGQLPSEYQSAYRR